MYESTITDLRAAIGSLETEKQRIDEQLRALETTLRYFENREGGDGPAHAFSVDDSSAHVQVESSEHTWQRIPEGQIREWPGISSTARLILMELASWADDTLIVEMSYASITEALPWLTQDQWWKSLRSLKRAGYLLTIKAPARAHPGLWQIVPRRAVDSLPKGSLRDAMAEILAAEGPLHRREIYERLARLGVPIDGQDPINNLSAHLSIDSRFENVGVGVWQLAEPRTEAAVGGDEEEGDDVPW